MSEQGHISIHTDNILPIIKKWLYSEKDIFLRELVSNAADAIYKLEKIALSGESKAEPREARIDVRFDKDQKTISIEDSGLGLTADEIKKYINQVAFSGVKDFVDKYQLKSDEEQVIGHFGLGFYSAFMVAGKVEIDSLSYQEGAEPAHWICEGSTAFTLTKGTRTQVGTKITLHLSEDSLELVDPFKLREILDRYCAFIRYPIYLEDNLINDPKPLWTKAPSALTDDDYKTFYQKLFPMAKEPLFWIHLNVDYPFKLRGVLYFPELKHELDASEGKVKLYCNQVYVAENPKELLPEFLTLLKGVIDCQDLPLNVSRSYLQSDSRVQQIQTHIIKKVADKLTGLANTERETFEKYWDSIAVFVKYGMLREPKFMERMKTQVLFKTSENKYLTLDGYLESYGEKTDKKIIYATDPVAQSSAIQLFKDHGIATIYTTGRIDQHFLPYMEMESQRAYQFQRVDAELPKDLIATDADAKILDPNDQKTADDKLKDLFTQALGEGISLDIQALKSDKVPAMLIQDESSRRLREMAQMGMGFEAPELGGNKGLGTLVINKNSLAVKNLLKHAQSLSPDPEALKLMAEHIYDLARLQQSEFGAVDMQHFMERAATLLGRL